MLARTALSRGATVVSRSLTRRAPSGSGGISSVTARARALHAPATVLGTTAKAIRTTAPVVAIRALDLLNNMSSVPEGGLPRGLNIGAEEEDEDDDGGR
eukprot:CAMPEP_0194032128 /NCGR_PEP_ID=MMETSP0009_2-20130614/5137_1 /TAXON_ID=210454 /ORGANISM="Grammatophora oceanica, Strain CCMP 410" /LENGTH=98 /DNA_ID=CAMNT_0038672475 /DNA_START=275 /DNA_END=571 /DNA_ORIENTATION=+